MNCPNCGKKMVRGGFAILSDGTSRDVLFCFDGCRRTMAIPADCFGMGPIGLPDITDATGQGLYAGRSAPPIERCDIKPEWDEAVKKLLST